jgi:hypothetical protein
MQREIVAALRRTYGPAHPAILRAQSQLGRLLVDGRELQAAEREFRQALSNGAKQGATHALTLEAQCELGGVLIDLNRHADAQVLLTDGYRELGALREATLPYYRKHLTRYTAMLKRLAGEESHAR